MTGRNGQHEMKPEKAVARWFEIVYNRRRRHSSIGMISPVDFEARIADQDDKRKPLFNR